MKKRILATLLLFVMLVNTFAFALPTEIAAANNLSVSGGVITVNQAIGGINTKTITLKDGSGKALDINSASMDGSTIHVELAGSTAPSAKVNATVVPNVNVPVTYEGTSCTLSGGTGTMTVKATVRHPQSGQPMGGGSFTIALTTEVVGEACSVTLPSGEGYTVTGNPTSNIGSGYSFTVAVLEGYNGSNMTVTVEDANGNPIATTSANGSYVVESVPGDMVIKVGGVVKKTVRTVTLVNGDGYTLTGNGTAYDGESYAFTLALKGTHMAADAGIAIVVTDKNDEALSDVTVTGGANGSYTIAAVKQDIKIKATGIRQKAVYTVTKPTVEGVTFTGSDSFREGDNYTFTIAVQEGYNGSALAVSVKDTDTGSTIPHTASGSSYTVSGAKANLTVAVSGVFKKEAYTVTPPTGEGFTFTGGATAYKGESYTFTVKAKDGYDGSSMTVTVNGSAVALNSNGSYTITDVQQAPVITVFGLKRLTQKVIYTGNSKPDSMWGYIASLTVLGVGVKENTQIGDHFYVVLDDDTAADALVQLSYTTGPSSRYVTTLSGKTSFNLSGGKADENYTATTKTFSKTWNFSLHFATKAFPAYITGDADGEEHDVYTNETYTQQLDGLFSDYFNKPLTYWVSVDGGAYRNVNGNAFSITPAEAGTRTLAFKANNGVVDSEEIYTVTLNVQDFTTKTFTVNVPEDITPVFHAMDGFDESGLDIAGAQLTPVKGAAAEGLVPYTLTVDNLAEYVSVRAEGFGCAAVEAEAGSTVTLRPVKAALCDLAEGPVEGTVVITYGEENAHTAQANAENNFLLAVGEEYTYTSKATDAAFETLSKTEVLPAGDTAWEVTLTLGVTNPITITATAGAKAQLYSFVNYYKYTEYPAKVAVENDDGTVTHYFSVPSSLTKSEILYRVSMPGKITKAGYFTWNQTSVSAVYSDSDKNSDYRLDDYSATGWYNAEENEDGVLLNVNSRNHLYLQRGGSKTLKGYRAWEITNTSSGNHLQTPDYTYTVVAGEGIVGFTDQASLSAADGDWKTVHALNEGVAVIEATYGAMEIKGSGYDGIYGASDPARTGLVVVQVGGSNDTSVKFGIDGFASYGTRHTQNISYNPDRKLEWDAEFDTFYFTGEKGEMKLTPTAGSAITDVSVSHDKGNSWTSLTGDNGTYTAPLIHGNNILRVTTASGTAYQVVRGDRVSVRVTEVADKSDGDGLVEAGETVRVSLIGLHTPIPKISGNYNPGYGNNTDGYSKVHINYTANGEDIYGPGKQYTFITEANYVEVTMPADGSDMVLSNGYIGVGVIGLTTFAEGGDSHRNIPDAGCTTRGSVTTYHTRSVLPELTIAAEEEAAPNQAPIAKAGAPTEATITADQNYAINPETLFSDPDGDTLTFTVSVNGAAPVAAAADYKFTPDGVGDYTLRFTASDGEETAEHTILLTVTAAEEEEDKGFGLAEDEIAGYVTVSFEDNGVRVTGETGLKFPTPLGTIIPATQVPFKQGENCAQVTKRLLDYHGIGMSITGSLTNDFYLSAIHNFVAGGTPYSKMGEQDAGEGSGWMYTLNGVFVQDGADACAAKNGDVLRWQYTCQWGKDIGDTTYWGTAKEVIDLIDKIPNPVTLQSEAAIKAARAAYDKLSGAMKQRVTNYDKLVKAEEEFAKLKEEADKKAAKDVEALIDKIKLNSDTFEKDVETAKKAYDKLTDDQKKLVKNYAKLADALKELASEEDRKAAEEVEDLIEAIGKVSLDSEDKIKAAREAYEKLTKEQKELVNNLAVLEAAEEALDRLKKPGIASDIYRITGDYLETLGVPTVNTVGGEWMVIGLARSGRPVPDGYYDNVVAFVRENIDGNERLHGNKSTENARVILALTAIGRDVTDVDGHDLLAGLDEMAYIQKQGINGPIWALLAFDSGNYPTPANSDVTREALVQVILDAQLEDGGWSLTKDGADADMTGMALQALAPYYKNDPQVKDAVDRAVVMLSDGQAANGSFAGAYGESCESVAQVIVALTALGINPDTDPRFIKNGNSLLDALCAYYVEGGGFCHFLGGERDGMATEQGYYALAAYYRMLGGKNALYDMTDVIDMGADVPVPEQPEEAEKQGGIGHIVIISAAVLAAAAGIAVPVAKRRKK